MSNLTLQRCLETSGNRWDFSNVRFYDVLARLKGMDLPTQMSKWSHVRSRHQPFQPVVCWFRSSLVFKLPGVAWLKPFPERKKNPSFPPKHTVSRVSAQQCPALMAGMSWYRTVNAAVGSVARPRAWKSISDRIMRKCLKGNNCMSLSLKLYFGFPKLAKVKILSNGIFGCVLFAHEEDNRFFSL